MTQVLTNWAVEEWTKVILATTALVAVIVGPLLQWFIAKRQAALQEQIAKRQTADNISSKRQNWIDELRKDVAEFRSCRSPWLR